MELKRIHGVVAAQPWIGRGEWYQSVRERVFGMCDEDTELPILRQI